MPAGAFAAPTPFVPILPAPPLPTGPLGRSLSGAYQAIVGAQVSDPAAAQRAAFLYAQARQRALSGDVSGALAAAASAQAAALSARPATAELVPAQSTIPQSPAGRQGGPSEFTPAGTFPGAATVPLADEAGALPAYLLVARNEIELAARVQPGSSLEPAKKQYRSALDAYLSGNAAAARAAARAAFDSAAEVFSKAK